ncbi:MAG: SDR family oxidoreductase [Lentisphaeria bacterium]|nr:SDR family oxidoreductase [Lentisphaeria bacterium]
MDLSDKRILITGAAKRIGAEIARKMAAAGCRVIIHCNTSYHEAEKLAAALPGSGHTVIPADLAVPGEVERLIEKAGRFELLVNSAALFFRPGSPEDLNAAGIYRQVNYLAPKRLLEYFSSQSLDEGAAVNITDAFALLPGSGAYWQSKCDLNKLTGSLALEWARKNLRINAVAPGPVLPPPWAPESRMEKILQQIPLKRPVKAADIAEMVKFLLSCGEITGNIISIDGGVAAGKK